MHGIESYIAVPLHRRDGRYFGTLCALDPLPVRLDPKHVEVLRLLADLIAFELEADEIAQQREADGRDRRAFIEAIIHDLRTPLTTAKAQTQIMLRRLRRADALTPDAIGSGLRNIERHLIRTEDLTSEMLDAANLRDGGVLELYTTAVDLIELAREAVDESQRRALHVTVRLQADELPIIGHWDRSRLTRVLANVLDNAAKFSPAGQHVTVRVDPVVIHNRTWAQVVVVDEGSGIPADDLPHVFEYRRRGTNAIDRVAGTGIGLAGAKQIVEHHRGTIEITSREGEGTTVTVRLPLPSSSEPVTRVQKNGASTVSSPGDHRDLAIGG